MDSKLYKDIGQAVEYAEKHGGDLTTKNLRYVWSIAEDMSRSTGADPHDLFVEGVIAMKKAEEKYDPSKNDNFCKYAASSIRGYMLNVVNRQSSLVHIPVNHLKGFKKGQETKEDVQKIVYDNIDAYSYDRLGKTEFSSIFDDRYEILQRGLAELDESSRIAIKMKLRLDEYEDVKDNNLQAIAEELEVPVNIASKIYKKAVEKLSKYCQGEMYG